MKLSMNEDSEDQQSTVDTASTISRDTEGSRFSTPPPPRTTILAGQESTWFFNLRTTYDIPGVLAK